MVEYAVPCNKLICCYLCLLQGGWLLICQRRGDEHNGKQHTQYHKSITHLNHPTSIQKRRYKNVCFPSVSWCFAAASFLNASSLLFPRARFPCSANRTSGQLLQSTFQRML